MHRRISLLIAAVAVLCLAVAVPTASAGKKTDRAQNKKLRSQSKAIKKNSTNIKKGAGAIKKGGVDVTKLNASAAALGNSIAALKVVADRADGNAKTVLDAAPAIIKGLTDLKTGLETAGAGLVGLRTAAAAQEYGWIEVTNTGGTGTPGFFMTSDIPDAVQHADASQTFVATAGTTDVATRFGVRGNESDGDGTTAAASCLVSIVNVTTPGVTSTAPVAVPTKSTLAATLGAPFSVLNGTDQPVAGPTGAVVAGNVYTVRLACTDQTPSSTDPSA